MPQAAIHDFFRQIRVQDNNQGGAVDQTLVADSTTDTLLITSHGGLIFESPNASTDAFGLNVDYSVNVPLGTTALTLTDIISNSTNVNFTGGPGVTVVRNSANELEIGLDEGYTAIKRFAIGADDSTLRFLDDGESALFLGTGGITTSSDAEGNITIDGSSISSGALGSLSVTTNSAGIAALSYNSGTGVFTYTPPDLSSFIDLTDLSVGAPAAASGSGAIAYQPLTGVFTYTPPDILNSFNVVSNAASGNGTLTYNNGTGTFTYTPPDLSGFITSEANDLTTAVTWVNVPDANITQSSVTQHEAALGINESQITFTSSFIELLDLSATNVTASGNGSLSYNNATGVFTFTPPDLSSYLTSEANDLTASVTWANVPPANITQTAVTQHQSAITISESQITDLQSYLTAETSHADVVVDGDFPIAGFMKTDGAGNYTVDNSTYLTSYTETDPVVGAVTGLVKSDGAGNISAATAGTDYLVSETITLATLKTEVAASIDFADFQSRIAAL